MTATYMHCSLVLIIFVGVGFISIQGGETVCDVSCRLSGLSCLLLSHAETDHGSGLRSKSTMLDVCNDD